METGPLKHHSELNQAKGGGEAMETNPLIQNPKVNPKPKPKVSSKAGKRFRGTALCCFFVIYLRRLRSWGHDAAAAAASATSATCRTIQQPQVGVRDSTAASWATPGGRILIRAIFCKWAPIVLNLVVEAFQAGATQEQAVGKMSHKKYLTLSMITSSICLMISLFEVSWEACSSVSKWPKQVRCCWSSYPRLQGLSLEGFLLYVGLICSVAQFTVNFTAKLGKDIIKFEMMPLVFSIGHALAKILGHTSSMTMDILHCGIHDQFEVKPTIVNGRKTYKCLQCESGLARSDRGRVRTQGPLSPPEPDKDEVQISRVGTQGPLSPEPDIDEVRGGRVGTQGPLSPPEPDNDEVQARVPSGATPFLTGPVLRRPSAARMMHTENKLVQLTNVNPQDQAFVISFLA